MLALQNTQHTPADSASTHSHIALLVVAAAQPGNPAHPAAFPNLLAAPRYVAELAPGDLLLIPSGWLHEVDSQVKSSQVKSSQV